MADEYDQSLNHTQEFNLQEGDKVYMAKEVTMCYHMAIKTILADSQLCNFFFNKQDQSQAFRDRLKEGNFDEEFFNILSMYVDTSDQQPCITFTEKQKMQLNLFFKLELLYRITPFGILNFDRLQGILNIIQDHVPNAVGETIGVTANYDTTLSTGLLPAISGGMPAAGVTYTDTTKHVIGGARRMYENPAQILTDIYCLNDLIKRVFDNNSYERLKNIIYGIQKSEYNNTSLQLVLDFIYSLREYLESSSFPSESFKSAAPDERELIKNQWLMARASELINGSNFQSITKIRGMIKSLMEQENKSSLQVLAMCILERNEFKETTSSKLSDIIDLLGCRGVHISGTRAGDAAIEVGSPTDLEISEQITDGKIRRIL